MIPKSSKKSYKLLLQKVLLHAKAMTAKSMILIKRLAVAFEYAVMVSTVRKHSKLF